jgi:hypothetical protein
MPMAPAVSAPMLTRPDQSDPAHDALRPAAARVNPGPEIEAARPALRMKTAPVLGAYSPAPLVNPGPEPARGAHSPAPRARVEPLSADRFLVKFTASRALKEKLDLACDSMRHSNPHGALEVILERAIDLLIADLQKKQQGRTNRPRNEPPPSAPGHVTRAARREVVARDGWRCAYVSADGRRCDARAFLEFDHVVPRGCGGGSRARNLRVLCRAHNRRAAERVYGEAHVARAISASRGGAERPPSVKNRRRRMGKRSG